MKKTTALLFALSVAAFAGACSKGSTPVSTPEAKTEAPAPAVTTGTAAGKVGVAECDEYVDKYQKCISGKVPEAAQAALKSSFDTAIMEWQKAAATPEGKTSLAMACKAALDAAKQSMGAYGCEW